MKHGHVIKKRDKREKRGERVNAGVHTTDASTLATQACTCAVDEGCRDCGFPDFFRHLGLHASRTDIRVPWSTWTCESKAANLFRHASYTTAATNKRSRAHCFPLLYDLVRPPRRQFLHDIRRSAIVAWGQPGVTGMSSSTARAHHLQSANDDSMSHITQFHNDNQKTKRETRRFSH